VPHWLDPAFSTFLHPFNQREGNAMSAKSLSAGKNAAEVSKEKLISDFKVVVADAEALLKASAGQGGEALAAVRARVEDSLAVAKSKMLDAEEELLEKTRVAAKATDEYVHEHPWNAVGIAAGVGLLLGLLISRR
jgi:ElaB/YqjD/DUF883 family membrane-anchored ribosome-binding protein